MITCLYSGDVLAAGVRSQNCFQCSLRRCDRLQPINTIYGACSVSLQGGALLQIQMVFLFHIPDNSIQTNASRKHPEFRKHFQILENHLKSRRVSDALSNASSKAA